MRERLRRLILWTMMFALTVMLYIKSHWTGHQTGPVVFLRDQPEGLKVKVAGNVVFPGIYQFPEKSDLRTVIKMAVPSAEQEDLRGFSPDVKLKTGDVVELLRGSSQRIDITVNKMQANEKIILGIPLDPNLMDAAEWDSLTGIGPVLALRIVDDRQLNGDFRSVADLKRVPGIGKNKIKSLERYF
jgi:competence protein ComEA